MALGLRERCTNAASDLALGRAGGVEDRRRRTVVWWSGRVGVRCGRPARLGAVADYLLADDPSVGRTACRLPDNWDSNWSPPHRKRQPSAFGRCRSWPARRGVLRIAGRRPSRSGEQLNQRFDTACNRFPAKLREICCTRKWGFDRQCHLATEHPGVGCVFNCELPTWVAWIGAGLEKLATDARHDRAGPATPATLATIHGCSLLPIAHSCQPTR